MSVAALIGLTYLASEIVLTITHRSRGTGVKQDRSTLGLLWLVITLSVVASVYAARHVAAAILPRPHLFAALGAVIFVLGLALRWWAIIVLGRFFTVDVQIASDHELVERGPFRLLRHPSYTGILLAFLGFGLSLANWLSLVVLLVPITIAFLRRMNVEEGALRGGLGNIYAAYIQRTYRLIPYVY